jgi:hypothetical protein
MVAIPEGQLIVCCPFCQMRSFVRGERGVLRYQVPARVERQKAQEMLRKFLTSSMAIAPAAARQAQLNEMFLVYLPFWTVWSRLIGWVFGEKKVGSGDHKHYEPREVRVVQDMSWNGAACDVGEFGVHRVTLPGQDLHPFDPDVLHQHSMVFEPVGSFTDARDQAEKEFEQDVRHKAGLDRFSQVFIRMLRRRYALVYHPLWVLRYLFRGRSFQVVVDGYSGQILYGKAPGNTLYRALVLVGGMAIGAFTAIDINAAILYNSDNHDVGWLPLALLVIGFGIMFTAYRTFRRGEQYEYRQAGSKGALGSLPGSVDIQNILETVSSTKDVEKWLNQLR